MNIMLRVDASIQMGSGHVLRCLALAEALRAAGLQPVFAAAVMDEAMRQRLGCAGFEVLEIAAEADAETAIDWLRRGGFAAVVVDHYGLDAGWEARVRAACDLLVAVDDFSQRPHVAELVVDGNAGSATAYRGRIAPQCRLLAGQDYALLRPEFARARRQRGRPAQGARQRVLVCFGGSDEANETAKVLAGLADYPGRLDVVIGGANPHRAGLLEQLAPMPRARVHVDVQDMAALLAEADVAIGAAGVSSWERCALGVPSLVAVLADNQRGVARQLEALGVARVLGEHDALMPADYRSALEALDADALRQMAARAWQVVDGEGRHGWRRLCAGAVCGTVPAE